METKFSNFWLLTVDISGDVKLGDTKKILLPKKLGVVMGCKNMKTKFCWDASQLRYEPLHQKTEKTEISPKISLYIKKSLLQSLLDKK